MKLFLGLFLFLLYASISNADKSKCYNFNGDPTPCEPSLTNLAQDMRVEASSTCGTNGSENVCSEWMDKSGKLKKSCEICDFSNPVLSKPSNLVVDSHVRGKETCWISKGLKESDNLASVNLTLALKKRSLVAFITVELCGHNPDGIIIYKMDKELDEWSPWQYFAKDCRTTFGMEHLNQNSVTFLSNGNRFQPVCFDLEKSIDYGGEDKIYRLIPFNPKHGRIFNAVLSDKEQDWLTATDIRISYILMPKTMSSNYALRDKRAPDDLIFHFGSSDVTVGGQPLCNGHAYSIIANPDGSYQCECQHSTSGKDCEKCHPEFNDQPWRPATAQNPSVCKRCECNNHSNKCRFDIDTYLKSGRRHGSYCINCGDNTAGPQCDRCAPGFYRNRAFPIYHKNACQPCQCHNVGSYSTKPCHEITGKCVCKLGVTGDDCAECAIGYRQTSSPIWPCSRIPGDVLSKKKLNHTTSPDCKFCQKRTKNVNFKRFCQKQIIIRISLKSKESRNQWVRFISTVENVWTRSNFDSELPTMPIDTQKTMSIWVKKDLVNCGCINMEFGRSYLVMATVKTREFMGQNELIVTQKDVVEEWNDIWDEKFARFTKLDFDNRCLKFKRLKRNLRTRRISSNYYNQYGIYS